MDDLVDESVINLAKKQAEHVELEKQVKEWLEIAGNKITVLPHGATEIKDNLTSFNHLPKKRNKVPPLLIKKPYLITNEQLFKRFNKHAKAIAIEAKQKKFIAICKYHGFSMFQITEKLTHCIACRKKQAPTLKKWKK